MQGPCSNVQKKKLRHPCAGAMKQCPVEDKASGLCRGRAHLFSLSRSAPARNSHLRTSTRGFHRFAPREHHGRRFWRVTCQGQPQLLHSSSPGYAPELWAWIWPVGSVALPSPSGRRTPATAPAHPDARAQPYVDCAVPLGVLSALFPSHLRQEPRRFSFEGASWRGAVFPHPFLQPQCCLQRSLEV